MQVPAPFEYEHATSIEHAVSLLERLGPEAKLVAGGHSLFPMMKLRLARPEALVDINDLTELTAIRIENGELRIGALVRHAELLASPVAGEQFPILHDAERVIADPIVRNRGTVGGSLCQADPSEDLSAAFAALKARVLIRGSGGERIISVRELHAGPYETVLGPAEILTEIRIGLRPGCGSAYQKVERRVGDYPVAAAGAAVWMQGNVIADAGIGLTAVGAPHFFAGSAEQAVIGREPNDETLDQAAQAASADCHPVTDQRGPADYKRHLAGELTRRALRRAIDRARGEGV